MSIVEKLGITPWPLEADFDEVDDLYIDFSGVVDDLYIDCSIANKEVDHIATVMNRRYTYLFQAAPEMLGALVEIVSDIEKGLAGDHVSLDTSGVIKLIEKATGRTWAEVKELIK